MKTNRQELIDVLKAVKPALASKEIIEQSTSFVFKNNKVSTYNDEIMISHPIDLDLEGAVQAQQFFELLNKCKDEGIEITTTKSELKIKGGKFKAGIRLDAEINLPIEEIPMPGKRDWKQLPDEFIKAIQYCLFSAGTDMSKPLLTCIHMFLPLIESTDNMRLTQYTLDTRADKDEPHVFLPARAVAELINYPISKYGITKGWVHFKTPEGVVFSCRTMEGEFPAVKHIIGMKGEPITFPTNMTETLERAEVMSETEITRERIVSIEIHENSITVKSRSKVGWYKEKFRARYSGSRVLFSINARFLMEILKHLRKAELDSENGQMIKFTGDNFVHVIAVMKIEEEADVEPF